MIQRLMFVAFVSSFCGLATAQEQEPLLRRLDDASRARVLAALAGLIILGFAMILLTWLGARITQRYRRGRSFFQPTERPASGSRKKPAPPEA
jgi:hypothetical protein